LAKGSFAALSFAALSFAALSFAALSFAASFIKCHVTQQANAENGSHDDHRPSLRAGVFFGARVQFARHC
jgi:hypothetical protein